MLPGGWLLRAVFFLAGAVVGIKAIISLLLFGILFLLVFNGRVIQLFFLGLFIFLGAALNQVYAGFDDFLSEALYLPIRGVVKDISLPDKGWLLVGVRDIVVGDAVVPLRADLKIRRFGAKWDEKLIGKEISLVARKKGNYFVYQSDSGFVAYTKQPYAKWIRGAFFNIRQCLYASLTRGLPCDTASLVSAVILGIKDRGFYRLSRMFYSLGVGHMLAISGLHLGIALLLFSIIFKACFVPYRLRWVLLGLIAIGYMLIVGYRSVSLTRSAVMFLFFAITRALEIEADPFDVLGMAILAVVLTDPFVVYQIGFQLSIIAVFVILLGSGIIKAAAPSLNKPAMGFLLGFIIYLFIAPIAAYYFGFASFAQVLLTPILVLLFMPILFLGVCSALLGGTANFLLVPITSFVLKVVEYSQNVFPPWGIARLNSGHMVTYYIVLCAILLGAAAIARSKIKELSYEDGCRDCRFGGYR